MLHVGNAPEAATANADLNPREFAGSDPGRWPVARGAALAGKLRLCHIRRAGSVKRDVTTESGEEIMMEARLDFYGSTLAAKFAKYINSAGAVLTGSAPPSLNQGLVKIRASQINR